MSQTRRQFLRTSSAGGAGLLTFLVGGCEREMTPAQARKESLPLQILTGAENDLIEALGEVLLPGSAAAGLAHFVDHQLAAAPDQQMLMIKYLGVGPPFLPFYRQALASVDAAAQQQHQLSFTGLATDQATALVGQVASGTIAPWDGPPPGLFYFVLRNDAVDVVYGTVSGFKRLGIPYSAHVMPPSRWGE